MMGQLVDGVWTQDTGFTSSDGSFKRKASSFRDWVTADGGPGPTGQDGYKAEAGRYHLYVSYACPWAHRTLIYRELCGLSDAISLSVVHWLMRDDGWTFQEGDGVIADSILGKSKMHEVYTAGRADYTGRVTVPVLWDKKRGTVVSNESSEIIRMFDEGFCAIGGKEPSMRPDALKDEIDALNEPIYHQVNNGVYKAGFASTQSAYEDAVQALFQQLDTIEERLSTRRYLCGDVITEADWRLFTTLIRFDAVYVAHFKCNLRPLWSYPNIWGYTRELYAVPGVKSTCNFEHIKNHYFQSHRTINPHGVVPAGPILDYDAPHGRG